MNCRLDLEIGDGRGACIGGIGLVEIIVCQY